MDVEVAHSVFEPGRQFVRRHERTGNLAGRANLLDRKADPLCDGLRPRLPERRGRRIPHVLGEIAGADEEHVNPLHREQLIDVVDRFGRLDHGDDQPPLVIGEACVAHRLNDGARLVRGIDHRHH